MFVKVVQEAQFSSAGVMARDGLWVGCKGPAFLRVVNPNVFFEEYGMVSKRYLASS